jgi:hypothetical protein
MHTYDESKPTVNRHINVRHHNIRHIQSRLSDIEIPF